MPSIDDEQATGHTTHEGVRSLSLERHLPSKVVWKLTLTTANGREWRVSSRGQPSIPCLRPFLTEAHAGLRFSCIILVKTVFQDVDWGRCLKIAILCLYKYGSFKPVWTLQSMTAVACRRDLLALSLQHHVPLPSQCHLLVIDRLVDPIEANFLPVDALLLAFNL